MDSKTLATILFRTLGVSYLIYGVFYAPYLLVTGAYNDTFIISSLSLLTNFGAGFVLFALAKPLAALVVWGLGRNMPPPAPPRFENQ